LRRGLNLRQILNRHVYTNLYSFGDLTWFGKNSSNSQQIQERAVKEKPSQQGGRSLRLQAANPIQTSNSVQQAKTLKRPRAEDEVLASCASPEPASKRVRASAILAGAPARWKTISDARVDYWRKNRTWPPEEQEMDCFRDIVRHALPRKRSSASLRRKRSDPSISAETAPTRAPSDQQPREQKSAPYNHPLYEIQLKDRGSFMGKYGQGITLESEKLCQKLLETSQLPPKDTLFR
jgi:hypothetical protein